eukprot:jgi/Mesen1/3755/ME000205S03019
MGRPVAEPRAAGICQPPGRQVAGLQKASTPARHASLALSEPPRVPPAGAEEVTGLQDVVLVPAGTRADAAWAAPAGDSVAVGVVPPGGGAHAPAVAHAGEVAEAALADRRTSRALKYCLAESALGGSPRAEDDKWRAVSEARGDLPASFSLKVHECDQARAARASDASKGPVTITEIAISSGPLEARAHAKEQARPVPEAPRVLEVPPIQEAVLWEQDPVYQGMDFMGCTHQYTPAHYARFLKREDDKKAKEGGWEGEGGGGERGRERRRREVQGMKGEEGEGKGGEVAGNVGKGRGGGGAREMERRGTEGIEGGRGRGKEAEQAMSACTHVGSAAASASKAEGVAPENVAARGSPPRGSQVSPAQGADAGAELHAGPAGPGRELEGVGVRQVAVQGGLLLERGGSSDSKGKASACRA